MTAHPHSIADVEFEQMRDERNHARDIACTFEQELAAAEASIARALDLIENSDHACCPCGAPSCGDSICVVCRARVELGGSL